jgi:HTH-type transcriptional regulator / antitoxin HigA
MKATQNQTGNTRKSFLSLPKDYAGLCRRLLPRKIHDRAEYDEAAAVVQVMALYDDEFTADQRDYFDLLCDLVEAYDKEHTDWPKVPEGAVLKHLMAEREMTGADLSRVLRGSRNLGTMILRGDRRLTVDHVRTLAENFGVNPSVLL